MKAYGVFEGGGARGYAHVGALRASEDRGIKFVAVAGTSIGAVIAALVAAGYTGRELYAESDGTEPERGLLAQDLEQQLLHQAEYGRIRRIDAPRRWINSGAEWLTKVPRAKAVIERVGAVFARAVSLLCSYFYAMWWLIVALSPVVFLFHGRLLRAVWSQSGATGTELFRTWLNDQLCRRLGKPPGELVRFGDLQRIKLRVVAADLSKGEIRVFGGPEHDNLEVAQAVAASISYPFFFRPARIGQSILVDGGMVSNFPAWVLDEVRDQQERSYPTFGFRLLDSPGQTFEEAWPGNASPGFVAFARRLLRAALNSRQSLESRRIDDYHPITLTTHTTSITA